MKKKRDDETEKKYFRPQTCRNCGITGHLYKDCIHPIMSFGIICYKIDENKDIKYLMIQRKDSLSFMEFIRGKYNNTDINYLHQLISSMTINEKKMIETKDFDEIWNYAWYQNVVAIIKPTIEYMDSKNKFNILKSNNLLQSLINESLNNHQEQEWGFPKGRRKLKESDINCAIREFCEETQLTKIDIKIIEDIEPFEELFFGTNNVLYKHTYYIGKIIDNDIKISVDTTCMEQMREVRDLNWYSYIEALQHIKSHNVERQQIIEKTHKVIQKYENIL